MSGEGQNNAGIKYTQLPQATLPLAGTEVVAIVQGGHTKQVTVDDLGTGITSTTSLVIGGATGGDQGPGTINATAIFINGVPIGGGGGSPGGADTQVQFNDGGVFGGDVNFVWDKTTNTLTITNNVDPSILGGGNNLYLKGRDALTTTDFGANIQLIAGQGGSVSGSGGGIEAFAGDAVDGPGGAVTMGAGATTGVGNAAGTVTFQAGSGTAGANGGDVQFEAGTSDSGVGGSFAVRTGGVATPRLAVDADGVWLLAGAPGTAKQVLTSNATAAPTWQDAPGSYLLDSVGDDVPIAVAGPTVVYSVVVNLPNLEDEELMIHIHMEYGLILAATAQLIITDSGLSGNMFFSNINAAGGGEYDLYVRVPGAAFTAASYSSRATVETASLAVMGPDGVTPIDIGPYAYTSTIGGSNVNPITTIEVFVEFAGTIGTSQFNRIQAYTEILKKR